MKKIVFFCIFGIFISNVYSDDLDSRIATFWNYILTNERDFFNMISQEPSFYDDLHNRVQLIDKNIYALLSNEVKNNKKDIIITAGGNKQYFDICDKIVSLAPKFTYLNPISLFPPLEKIEPFMAGNITLRVEDVRVHFDNDNGNIELLFLLEDKHLSNIRNDDTGYIYNIYMQMLYMMTQQILGEKITSEKIVSAYIPLLILVMPSMPIIELKNYIK